MGDNPFLKDTKEGASATDVRREFQTGIMRGKKLNLYESVRVEIEICLETRTGLEHFYFDLL